MINDEVTIKRAIEIDVPVCLCAACNAQEAPFLIAVRRGEPAYGEKPDEWRAASWRLPEGWAEFSVTRPPHSRQWKLCRKCAVEMVQRIEKVIGGV